MGDSTLLALPLVVLAGVLSFASPCFLPVVPVFVSYLVGGSPAPSTPVARRAAAAQAVVFVLGFTAVFVAMWASVGLLGHVLGAHRSTLRIVGGAIIVVLGLHVAGLIELPFLQRQIGIPLRSVLRIAGDTPRGSDTTSLGSRGGDSPGGRGLATGSSGRPEAAAAPAAGSVITAAPQRVGVPEPTQLAPSYRRSALLGLAFGAGWTPCIGPTLGGVIGLASTGDSVGQGIVLLLAYCVGLGIPFVLVALGAGAAHRHLRRLAAHHTAVSLISGGLLVLLGFAMITDLFGRFVGLFPVFGL